MRQLGIKGLGLRKEDGTAIDLGTLIAQDQPFAVFDTRTTNEMTLVSTDFVQKWTAIGDATKYVEQLVAAGQPRVNLAPAGNFKGVTVDGGDTMDMSAAMLDFHKNQNAVEVLTLFKTGASGAVHGMWGWETGGGVIRHGIRMGSTDPSAITMQHRILDADGFNTKNSNESISALSVHTSSSSIDPVTDQDTRITVDGNPYASGPVTSSGVPFSNTTSTNGRFFAFAFIQTMTAGGGLYFVALFQKRLSVASRQKWIGWMHWEAGIQSLLPADHPYRYVRPTV